MTEMEMWLMVILVNFDKKKSFEKKLPTSYGMFATFKPAFNKSWPSETKGPTVAQRDLSVNDTVTPMKFCLKIYFLEIENAFYKSFRSESKF